MADSDPVLYGKPALNQTCEPTDEMQDEKDFWLGCRTLSGLRP